MAELAGDAAIQPPVEVVRLVEKLESAGFETWLVGGGVRDALLGHSQLDWDLATAAHPDKVQKLFRRTVPVGIRFGTVGVFDDSGRLHEVTTFRRDVETDGRHAVVEYGASLDDDLARRDFTINAIAYHPTRGVRDPFGGREDLARNLVRAVGEPAERMREDRLRALRAMRFAARLGFEIEPRTWDAIVESAPSLPRLSPERVRQEIEKTLDQVAKPSHAFRLWDASGAFATLIPGLHATEESLAVIDCIAQPFGKRAPERRLLRLAALFGASNARDAEQTLRALRFPNDQIAWVTHLVEHATVLASQDTTPLVFAPVIELEQPATTDRLIRLWISRIGRTRLAAVLRLTAAKWASARLRGFAAPSAAEVSWLYRRAIRIAYRDPVQISDLAIDGNDVQKLGLKPGPMIRQIQTALLDRVLADPNLNTRDTLLQLAREHIAGTSERQET
jgi:tRNA nucleotidyltransferase (CCA-adding enzyme)